jgi:hypothetical protein
MLCTVQSFGNRKIINLGIINKNHNMIICDNETHNTVKALLSFKKQNYLPHSSLLSSKSILS